MELTNNETIFNKASKKIKRFFKWFFGIVIGILILFTLFAYYGSYSSGVRAGKVIKISKRGFLFKTWEGQLDLASFGAIKNSDNQFTQIFDFSISGDDIAAQLERAALNGERINLHYTERYVKLPWRGETKYFVDSIELSGTAQDPKEIF